LLPTNFQSLGTERSLLEGGCGVVDFSDRGVLEISGNDVSDFLHRISTNDFRSIEPGEALQTVLVTEKGRVVDSILVVPREKSFCVITGRGAQQRVKGWLERFIISEDISVRDRTGEGVLFGRMNAKKTPSMIRTKSRMFSFLTKYFSVDAEFYVMEKDESILVQFGALGYSQVGNDAYEAFRIENGIPSYRKEMTEEFNPLELNLRSQISFDKGCYIGQEVIARLDTYQKTQKFLCLVNTEASSSMNGCCILISNGKEIGKITSRSPRLEGENSVKGLAVIRKEYAVGGAEVRTKDHRSEVIIERVFQG
jgi:folate-binding protein YgfZ